MKKYEITNESIEFEGKTLYRIKALSDFDDVKAGEFGGFIECEDNLSNCDKCWIYNDAKVFGDAVVKNNAKIRNNAVLCDKAMAIENAEVRGNARMNGESCARQHSIVKGNARLTMNASVWGFSHVDGDAFLHKDACINGIDYDWIELQLSEESGIIVTAYKIGYELYNVTFSNSPHSFSLEELERKVEVCKTEEEKKHIECVVKEIKEFFNIEIE